MKGKRKLFDELVQGVDAMRKQREGKVTLRTHAVEKLPPLHVDADTHPRYTGEARRSAGSVRTPVAGFDANA